jgi:hypothetical protein
MFRDNDVESDRIGERRARYVGIWGVLDLVIDRSATGLAGVFIVLELFVRHGSVVPLEGVTLAVLESVPEVRRQWAVGVQSWDPCRSWSKPGQITGATVGARELVRAGGKPQSPLAPVQAETYAAVD